MSFFKRRQSSRRARRFRKNLLNSIGATDTSIEVALSDAPISTAIVGSSQILEYLLMCADGRTYVGVKGNYTMQNVTSQQLLTTGHTVMAGTPVTYTPPDGTLSVYYRVDFQGRFHDGDSITHYVVRLDGTQISNSRITYRNNGSHQNQYNVKQIFTITGTTNNTTGEVDTWNSPKTIDVTTREYNSSYEGIVHTTNHWDGGGSDLIVKPYITIIAFG